MSVVIGLAFCCAVLPASLWLWNMLLYREPESGGCGETGACILPDAVSVLIPARNEEGSIGASITSLLASRGVGIAITVLDDGSTDRTAEIVSRFANQDARVQLRSAPPLPRGWNGKQHACYALAAEPGCEILCFLDADVRLEPEALARMSAFLLRSDSDLVSGFPRQETETVLGVAAVAVDSLCLAVIPPVGRHAFPVCARVCGGLRPVSYGAPRGLP